MSWFKNAQLYRMTAPFTMTAAQLSERLTPHAFAPCTPSQDASLGWVPPFGGDLVHVVQGQLFFALAHERKILPKKYIDEVTAARCVELEEQQGFKPGRKQTREIRDAIIDELLPRAFPVKSVTRVWLDPVGGWLVVDTPSAPRCDDVFKLLLKSLETLPFASLRCERSPLSAMTDWLAADEAPYNFTVDQDSELRGTTDGKPTVRYVRHSLEPEDVRRHIAAGKQCTRLALTWSDRISIVLTESLALKRIAPLDVLQKPHNPESTANEDERRDGDLLLMAGEFRKMLADVVASLGGYELTKPSIAA